MPAILQKADELIAKIFLYGSTEKVLTKLVDKIKTDYPRAVIAGSISPPFRTLSKQELDQHILQINESVAELQAERLRKLREERDSADVERKLKALADGARAGENTMPLLLDCVRAYATLGEMCDALKPVFGIYQEPAF